MKKFILFLIILLSLNSCSQEKIQKESIRNDFEIYFNAVKSKNIDQAVNSIYPRFFEIVSKKQMKQLLNSTYNNPQLGFEVKDFKIQNIKEVEEIDHKFYTILNYRFNIELKLNSENLQNSKDMLMNNMQKKFGSKNVIYNEKDNTFAIDADKKAIAISDNGLDNWKFVILEDEYKPYLADIIPQKILNEN